MRTTGFFICSAGAVLIVIGVASAVDFQETPDPIRAWRLQRENRRVVL